MNANDMKALGEAHGAAGKVNAPNELIEVDQAIFAECSRMDRFDGARFYNEMRGAFNAGWERGYLIAQAAA